MKSKPKKCTLVRLEADNVKSVRKSCAENVRTVQGEVNAIVRAHYASFTQPSRDMLGTNQPSIDAFGNLVWPASKCPTFVPSQKK